MREKFDPKLLAERGPKVSILVTTYNQEAYIGACLDSILKQKINFPAEILVIDDSSSDKTQQIIDVYRTNFPNIVKPIYLDTNHKSNCLPVYSTIYAIARGSYIATCDGDDMWSDEYKLQKQVDFLDANQSYSFTFHNAVGLTENNRLISDVGLPESTLRDLSKDDLLRFTGWIYLGTIVFRKAFPTLPPEFDLVWNRDHILPIILGNYGAAKYQPEVGHLIYRQHSNASWSTRSLHEKALFHARTGLIITSYLLRIGRHHEAKHYLLNRLINELRTIFSLQ